MPTSSKLHATRRAAVGSLALPLFAGACAHPAAGPPSEGDATELASTNSTTDAQLERAVESIREEDLARHVQVLASDRFEGRFPGSPGETKTLSYISAAFARSGLVPAVDGDFTQEVPLSRATPDVGGRMRLHPAIAKAGEKTKTLSELAWGPDFLAGVTPATPELHLEGLPVVFGGYGIVAPEYDWDDYANVDLRGKVVIVLGGEPGTPEDARFEGRALTHHGTSNGKVEAAAARGAKGLLVLRADGEGGLAWDTLAIGARAPKYALRGSNEEAALAFRGLLREDRLARLLEGAGTKLADLQRAANGPGFVARPLPFQLDVDLAASYESTRSHNVVAVLPGRTRPDEYLVYTAHWDHVGTRPELEGDTIFNGAVDNATGIAALLELAEAYAALPEPPERSIVFVATTAEEQGLLGSQWYAENPVFPLARTVGVVNIDALFPFGAFDSMTVVAPGASELDEYLARAAEAVGRTLHADPMPELGAFFRSDHYPFAVHGVPALFAVGGPGPETSADSPQLARFEDYLTRRYHQPADEYDAATWDMAGIRQDVEIFFRLGCELANSTDMPNWRPDHAFRAKRDAMLRAATERSD